MQGWPSVTAKLARPYIHADKVSWSVGTFEVGDFVESPPLFQSDRLITRIG